MKLSTKLILSFSVVILLVGGIGITSSYFNQSVKDQVTKESREAIEEIELAGEMGLHLYRSLTRTQYLLEDQYRQSLSTDFSEGGMSNEVVLENIDKSLEKFRTSIQSTKALVKKDNALESQDAIDSTDVVLLLNELEKKFKIYTSLVKQLQKLSTESYADGKEFFTVTIEPYFRTNLLPLIEHVREEIQADHEQKIAGLNNKLDWIGRILGIATFLSLIVAISLTFFLYRSIANPIKKLAQAAKNIAQGDLDDRIDYESNDELGQLSQTFNNMAESLSRTTVSRDYVDSIIESMADLLIVTDKDYTITRINSAGLSMLERKKGKVLGQKVQSIFKNGQKSIIEENQDSKEKVKIQDTELLVGNNEEVPVNVSKGILRDRKGKVEGYVLVASDISSEREAQKKIKQSLREKEVLLAEIHHRVKNNLAVISGLLQMQIWEAENEHAASALRESQFRVRSIALVHEKLYQSENLSYIKFDQYIRDLLQAVSSTYIGEDSNIEIKTELEGVILNINQAIPCSLLLNELIVNAFKHAFDDQGGLITVSMRATGQKVTLQVKDNGKGFPKAQIERESLGMSLIDTLSKQLNGTLEFQNDNGADIKIIFEAEKIIND
jgi:PAS domain S-box-containing protein